MQSEQPLRPRAPASSQPIAAQAELQQYIPKELAAKLDAARTRGELAGERKLVTVLFADIVDSTRLAEKLDPEDWGEIVSGAHRRISEAIYRYEGTIAQLLGDGVLAFFGAPITHEDDPVRAVNAALDIQKDLAEYGEGLRSKKRVPDFRMRVGLNTGLVVVGNIGSDLHMEYLAIGDAINLAARMEQSAEPGTVQIAHDTFKHVKPFFEIQDLGTIQVKGKDEPVHAYRVLGRKEIGARARGVEGLHAEMVGREAEMHSLHNVLADLKQGIGGIVFILGEAGLGKSRLIAEGHQVFTELVGGEGNWHEVSSLSYQANQAYSLLLRLIRRVEGIPVDASPSMIGDKLNLLVQNLPEQRREHALDLLQAIFGLKAQEGGIQFEGEAFRRELVEVIRDWWRTRFRDKPTVLVFDDMHWSDAASSELLRELLPLVDEMPLILLCAMRSERQASAWHIKAQADEEYHPRFTELALRPLSESESNELVNRLLSNPELPERLRASVLEKSGGNPFFIEEVVRTLIDGGIVALEEQTLNGQTRQIWRAKQEGADFAIPDNLQALLAARMDRLEESTRVTLQIASVIGRSFYHRVLRVVDEASEDLDKHLATLVRLEMIRQSARLPEVEYMFRNPLTQEAVYKTILMKRRREFHRRVGEAVEALYPERRERLYSLLAFHFAHAGERARAIEYSRQAARQAASVYAYEDGIESLRAALTLVEPDDAPELRLSLLEELGDVYRTIRNFGEALKLYDQALALTSTQPPSDKVIPLRLHRKIIEVSTDAKWSVNLNAYREVSQISRQSRTNVEEHLLSLKNDPPHPETVYLLTALSMDAWRNQMPPDWDAAERFAQQAIEMAEQLDENVVLSHALGALANVLDGQSRLREHLQVAQRRFGIHRQIETTEPRESIDALRGIGVALMYVGEYEQALPYLSEAESLAARIRAADQQVNALGIQAQCLFRLDRWDEVLATEAKWRPLERQYSRERVGET